MANDILYHYTTGTFIGAILVDGRLRPRTCFLGNQTPATERAALWFTFSPTWEPIVADWNSLFKGFNWKKWRVCVMASTVPALLDWDEWAKQSRCDPKQATALRRCAESKGSDVSLWRSTFEGVLVRDWSGVEVLRGKTFAAVTGWDAFAMHARGVAGGSCLTALRDPETA
jgi:hypothetical protein